MNTDETLIFKHGCYSGDLIYAIAGIKAVCENHQKKAVIYQWLNLQAQLYEGAEHPYRGATMNKYAFDMMKPLIESQPYIQEFNEWKGEKVHLDLDQMRQVKNHMPYGNIVTWPAMVFVEMTPRYWEPWLHVDKFDVNFRDMIVINRTSRYHAPFIDYFHLKKHQDRMIFVGLKEEHQKFCIDWDIKIPYHPVKDFSELASVIFSCKLFIGNQSMCFAIAEALKVPRLLEVCDFAPNVQPCGEGGWYFRVPEVFQHLVNKLL